MDFLNRGMVWPIVSSTDLTFSVVIPTFNRPAELRGCLESLRRLDYPRDRFEVIVVDDGGTTPLNESVRSGGAGLDVQILRQDNAGPGRARNRGTKHAKGRFLAFTDDDCRPEAEWLTSFEGGFKEHPNAMLGGRTENYLDNSFSQASQLIMEIVYDYYNSDPNQSRFFASNNIALATVLYREVGGFDTTFFRAASEDRELCDRWNHLGHRLVYVPEARIRHGHSLNLKSYWHQHFNYGRGAFHYHRRRGERGSGQLRDDFSFYRKIPSLLRKPISGLSRTRAFAVLNLLLVWQAANFSGYLLEGLETRNGDPSSREA